MIIKDITTSNEGREPHYGVYTRLGCSAIHGVGVFAISDIKKGTHVFYGDDEETVKVSAAAVTNVPHNVQKLYKDFCPTEGGEYVCPRNFNQLTVAWYLNHSENPNMACNEDYQFYALRDIKEGEELTSDYRTYDEAPLEFLKQV
ncbi:MAG: SET domain-containing protein [Terriglobia bacterium]